MKIGWEFERKFLVRTEALPPLPQGSHIEQAYLGFDPVVRARVEDDRAWITVKGPGLKARREVQVPVPPEAARAMMDLRVPGSVVVRKRRHRVLFGGHIWEVDVFEAPFEGLVLAEVELSSRDEDVELPPWAGEEVTGVPAYQNANLARTGRAPGRPG